MPEKRNNQKMKNKQKKRKRKHLIWVAATVIALSSIGTVGALNGWFGGGGSVPEDTVTLQLMGYWNFDEGYGSTAYDSSGQGKHGQLATVWLCGDNVTFTYKGAQVTYGTVNSTSSKCWLDRNLGASQVATAYNDSAAYGDLFQWGRLDDQHQTRTSVTTTTLSSTDVPGHSNFIEGMGSPYDWRSPHNNNLWQGVSGTNNPCPSSWRIPTETELDTERASWSSQDYNGAFASPLKLTAGGYRSYSNGSLYGVGSNGYYWSSTVSGATARYLYFYSTGATMYGDRRALGFSVRCVQD